MEPILDRIHLDVEPTLLATLAGHLDHELAEHYPKGAVRKASRLGETSLATATLAGDEATAEVIEHGEAHRVAMTLPLFDYNGGYSYIKCTCQRESLHLDENRCHHMWIAQKLLLEKIQAEADRSKAGPAWEAFFASAEDLVGDLAEETAAEPVSAAPETRLSWRVDPDTFEVEAYLHTLTETASGQRASPGKRLGWHELVTTPALWQTSADQLAMARIKPRPRSLLDEYDIDTFGVLLDLADSERLYWSDRPTELVRVTHGHVHLACELVEGGVRPLATINGKKPAAGRSTVFAGQGFAVVTEEPRELLLAVADSATTGFLEGLARADIVIPLEQKDRLLATLVALERRLSVAPPQGFVEASSEPASDTTYLRLTPLEPRGLKVEMLRKPSPTGTYFPPGEGPEMVLDLTDRARPRTIARDLQDERAMMRRVERVLGLDEHPSAPGAIWHLRVDEAALDLMTALERHAAEFSIVVEWPRDAARPRRYELETPLDDQPLRVTVREERDWFNIKGGVAVGSELVELKDLIDALEKKLRYIQLGNGRWVQVTDTFRRRLERIDDLVERDGERFGFCLGAMPHAYDLAEADDGVVFDDSDGWREQCRRLKAVRGEADVALPDGFQGTLRPYQLDGYRWLCRLASWGIGGCLADDMGLGKTIQTIALLLRRAADGPILVVSPTSVSANWAKELRRFAPSLTPILYRDSNRAATIGGVGPGDVVIMSYGLLARDIELVKRTAWNVVVFDEAQALKNSQTKTAKAAAEVDARWCLALSGTPVENHLGELWSLFRVIAPGLLGSWERFKRLYAQPIERYRSQSASARLERLIRPFVLRRLKEDHLAELPAKTEIELSVELSAEERRYYEATRLAALQALAEQATETEAKVEGDGAAASPERQRFAMLAALTRLRQAACHPALLTDEWSGGSAKLNLFREICDELRRGSHRALVFSQFTRHLALLRAELDAMGASYLYLDGATPAQERQVLVDRFQTGAFDFFLISLKAGGTGLTLTAADYVLHMDPWWNPAVEDQATDRAHRMGQRRPVTVYRFVTRDTVEEKIMALHAAKRELVDQLLAEGHRAAGLSTAELMDLIQAGG